LRERAENLARVSRIMGANARPTWNRSGSAPHALSDVEVFCTEKDPGFFAALRMTQKKIAPASVRILDMLGARF